MTFDASKPPARNAYDAAVPPNLLNFMLKSWNSKGRKLPKVLPNAMSFRQRRERLSKHFPGARFGRTIPTTPFVPVRISITSPVHSSPTAS